MKKSQKVKHVKIGDQVQILSGSQKGLVGKILRLDKRNYTAILDSTKNRQKYLSKKMKPLEEKTKILQKEIFQKIHISNLMLWDKEKNVASRIGYKKVDEKKLRYFKKTGNFVNS